jgi:3',5'-cyclic-AMP phosphodiesterase
MNALPPVDAIVVTGDIADDGSVEAYRLADALTAGKSARRYFIAGNHDDRSMMRAVFGEVDEVRVVELSERWSLVLLNSQWVGHEAGYVTDSVLDRLASDLDRVENHVLLCLHHPPLSPCPQPDCGLRDSDRLLEVLHGGPVRAVLSGHVHQDFEFAHEGITFLGAPSTFGQLRHGGDPHYTDTDAPPAAQLVELRDDGHTARRVVIVWTAVLTIDTPFGPAASWVHSGLRARADGSITSRARSRGHVLNESTAVRDGQPPIPAAVDSFKEQELPRPRNACRARSPCATSRPSTGASSHRRRTTHAGWAWSDRRRSVFRSRARVRRSRPTNLR